MQANTKIEKQRIVAGTSYELEFYDGFESGRIETRRWIPFYLPQWSSRKSSAPRFEFSDHGFQLKIEKDQEPWCPEFNGAVRVSSLQTGLFSGPLGSSIGQHRFSKNCVVREAQPTEKTYVPKYGYFELRARCDISGNNVAALWMIGFEDIPERSAEICIFELKGKNVTASHSIIGYGIHPFGDPEIVDEFYEDSFAIDVSEFNTYAVEWTESKVDFFINHRKIRTIDQSPDYEMQLMLNIYDLENRNSDKMSFFVDYVAGYRAANP